MSEKLNNSPVLFEITEVNDIQYPTLRMDRMYMYFLIGIARALKLFLFRSNIHTRVKGQTLSKCLHVKGLCDVMQG